MNDVIIANRDPTEKDNPNCLIWWNRKLNRFFVYRPLEKGKFVWEHLKEIEE